MEPAEILYVGNDLPDLAVLPLVGCFAAPADAHPDVLRRADLILKHRGGRGAVRELCERLLLTHTQKPGDTMNREVTLETVRSGTGTGIYHCGNWN